MESRKKREERIENTALTFGSFGGAALMSFISWLAYGHPEWYAAPIILLIGIIITIIIRRTNKNGK